MGRPPALFCCEGKVREPVRYPLPVLQLHFAGKRRLRVCWKPSAIHTRPLREPLALKEFQAVWGHSTSRHLSPIKKGWDGTEIGSGEASHRLWGTGHKAGVTGTQEELEVYPKKTQ